jgi:hypothetical protein
MNQCVNRWLALGVWGLCLGSISCVTTPQRGFDDEPQMTVRRGQRGSGDRRNQGKASKRKKAFERLCRTEELPGCDELTERKKYADEVSQQVKEHLALYAPILTKLRAALETPARAPDAKLKSKISLAEGKLNHEGPHSVAIAVKVKYDSGFNRHPRTNDILDLLDSIKEINNLLEIEDAYHREAFDQIKAKLVKLTLERDEPVVVGVPSADTSILTENPLPQGSVIYALVFSEPTLEYRVIKQWQKPMTPALTVAKQGFDVTISQTAESEVVFKETHSVKGQEVCASLRAEVRLLVAGSPRRKWAVTKRTKGGK